jgi:3-phenylpropionate/trans-cinnamate dioxygenase ferredoxin reductase subunit
MQYVGHAEGADRIRMDGDPEDRDFSALYSRHGRPVAAFTVERPRELVALRRLIEDGIDIQPEIKEIAA